MSFSSSPVHEHLVMSLQEKTKSKTKPSSSPREKNKSQQNIDFKHLGETNI
jgi:hypothetical protein